MTKQDTIDLLKIIKTNYQNLSIDNDVIKYWFNKLELYDRQDVLDRLDRYMNSEDYKEIPKVSRLIMGLKTTLERQKENKYDDCLVQCNLCKRWFNNKNIEYHYDKCLDLKFLEVKSNALGKPMTREQLEELSPKQIEELLNKHLPKNKNENIIKKY